MLDEQIVALYWARDEQAIPASAQNYGGYCCSIAGNILADSRDVEEVVSDTWLHAWNAIPPKRPSVLRTFFGRITRNLSFDRWKAATAKKRGGGELPLVLDELTEAAPDKSLEDTVVTQAMVQSMADFISCLPPQEANVFIRRYWFVESHKRIAERYGMTEGSVAVMLSRSRKKLKAHLEKEGWL